MIRANKIREYLALGRARDISAKQLLRGTDINPKRLEDPDYFLDSAQLDAVVTNLLRLIDTPDIGFTLGERFDPLNMGIVGYALFSSRTLRDAMDIWHQYSNPLLGSPLRLLVNEGTGDGKWSLQVIPQTSNTDLQRFFIEEFLVGGVKLLRLLAGQPPLFESIAFAYPRPAHHALYARWFNCPVSFGAALTEIKLRSPGLATQIRTNNEELNDVVSHYCRSMLQQLPKHGSAELRLRSLFLTNFSHLPNRDEAARHLGISRRTLLRRLEKNEVRTYRQLKEDFLLDLAKQYLDTGLMTQKQISHALGYTSPSAFCRAFKRWTGETPGSYREKLTARVPSQSQ